VEQYFYLPLSVPFCVIKNRDNSPSSSESLHHPRNEMQARNKAVLHLFFSLPFQIDVLRLDYTGLVCGIED
jgi:hypothetical protein